MKRCFRSKECFWQVGELGAHPPAPFPLHNTLWKGKFGFSPCARNRVVSFWRRSLSPKPIPPPPPCEDEKVHLGWETGEERLTEKYTKTTGTWAPRLRLPSLGKTCLTVQGGSGPLHNSSDAKMKFGLLRVHSWQHSCGDVGGNSLLSSGMAGRREYLQDCHNSQHHLCPLCMFFSSPSSELS